MRRILLLFVMLCIKIKGNSSTQKWINAFIINPKPLYLIKKYL
ncbi:MAG: hypothetical protein H6Q26_1344 [Bacteroidetes bacterium]|nr:hypothetical protein [Bacteroidota bacterium]